MMTKKAEFAIPGDLVAGELDTTRTESGSVFMCPTRPDDPTLQQWMRLVESCHGFDFWNDPAEDVYTENDGEPL